MSLAAGLKGRRGLMLLIPWAARFEVRKEATTTKGAENYEQKIVLAVLNAWASEALKTRWLSLVLTKWLRNGSLVLFSNPLLPLKLSELFVFPINTILTVGLFCIQLSASFTGFDSR